MANILHKDVVAQLTELPQNIRKPLILCDADEVLLSFMNLFEKYLHAQGLYYAWRSYSLDGNILIKKNGEPLSKSTIRKLLLDFYSTNCEKLKPVPGASEALNRLSKKADVIILTNIWKKYKTIRQRQLNSYNLDYPVICNIGAKGPAVAWITQNRKSPIYFIDDSSKHHTSVAQHAPHVLRIHFIAECRLACLEKPAENANFRTDTWSSTRFVIERDLEQKEI